ncbi:MAG TPA: F0F1 ATP synthase subunit A [Thermoanaerobaculia bacterium]|jgi:F-type H+-transporting ATPase subunit a|nr:F0F1 ATP synthase subunit A [Thermoanaerobaculia bacterium]
MSATTMMMLAFAENPLSHIVQHPLVQKPAHLGPLTPNGVMTVLSDQIVTIIVAGLLLILFVPVLVARRKGKDAVGSLVPSGFGNAIEAICTYIREEVARPNLKEHTDRFVKYLWTVFFFILTMNLLGLLPIAPVSKLFGTHLGGAPTGNIWVTASLAICTLLMMVINGLRLGGKSYLAHFSPGPLWLAPLLVPLEIIGVVAKTFALTVRLFANMLAGHVLLAVLLGFIVNAMAKMGVAGLGIAIPAVAGSVAISMLELFVAFLHAFIFTFLTALFIGQSVVFHHDDEHDSHDSHHEPAHGATARAH